MLFANYLFIYLFFGFSCVLKWAEKNCKNYKWPSKPDNLLLNLWVILKIISIGIICWVQIVLRYNYKIISINHLIKYVMPLNLNTLLLY